MFSSSIFLNNIYDEFHGRHEDCMEKAMFPISEKCFKWESRYNRINVIDYSLDMDVDLKLTSFF